MASVLTIDISATRAITATGRLVAGETASISIVGATPAKLYLISAQRDVIAYCDSFGADGSGAINLATTQIASIVANIPAGRAFSVSCIVEGEDGAIVGYGYVPMVSAPMPDALDPLDEDLIYAKLSDLRDYLTRAEAAATYATLAGLAPVASTGSYNDLTDKPTIPTVPVQSVNGQTGAVSLTGADIPTFNSQTSVNDYLTALDQYKANATALRYAAGETITASAQLADRTGNRVMPTASNTADIVLTFPAAVAGYLRDFLVLVTNTSGNTGNITFTPPTGAIVYGDGFTHSPASGETWLYSVTEEAANVFWCKSEKMEVAQ